MKPVHPARRRAEQFDSLVEGSSTGRTDARLAELVDLVEAVRQVPAVEPRADFVTDLRERLMVAARTDLVPAEPTVEDRLTVAPRSTVRERRIGAAIAGLALVGATTSMAVASQSALPGETLYPVKRAIENAQTSIKSGDDKGANILDHAQRRLDEVDELSQSRDAADAEEIAGTLQAFSDQTTQASDLLLRDYEESGQQGSITELRSFTVTSIDSLSDLETVVPASAHDALLNAAAVVFNTDAAATQVCPTCEGTGIVQVPTSLVAATRDVLDQVTEGLGALSPDPATGQPAPGTPKAPSATDVPPAGSLPTIPPVLPNEAPSNGSSSSGGSTASPSNGGLLGGLLGGDKPSKSPKKPKNPPLASTLDDVLDGVVEGVGGLLGGLTDPLSGP